MKKILILLLTATSITVSCDNKKGNNAETAPQLTYRNVIEMDINNQMTFVGETSPNNLYTTQPRISGFYLKRYFDSGDMVEKGNLLYTIDPAQYQIALSQAKADLSSAIAQEKNSLSSYNRNVPLAKINAISQSTLDNVTAQLIAARESVKAKQEVVKQAKLNLSYTKIYAPATGIASSTIPSPGDYVGVGTQFPILNKIHQNDTILVTISIPMQKYLDITKSSDFNSPTYINNNLLSNIKMELSNGEMYDIDGKYSYTMSSINTETDAIELVTLFPNPNNSLKSGQFVKIHCNVGKLEQKTLIPQNAIFRTQNINLAYSIEDNIVKVNKVELGDEWGDFWIVEDGVKSGDKVLTEGFFKVKNGDKVKLITTTQQ